MDINTPFITDPKQIELLKSTHTGALKYTLLNDFLSKYSFQKDLYALKGLLAALLKINIDDITDIEILNPIEPGNDITEKDCILDIKLELNHTTIINIEIQALYRLLNTENHREYSSKFEIRVLSLNQLENATLEEKNDPNSLYHWARLFKASTWEELKMITQDNPMMNSFVGTVMQLTAEEKVAQACEMRRRYSNDIATYEEEIATAKAKITELDADIAKKDAALAEKDAEIEELRSLLKLKD